MSFFSAASSKYFFARAPWSAAWSDGHLLPRFEYVGYRCWHFSKYSIPSSSSAVSRSASVVEILCARSQQRSDRRLYARQRSSTGRPSARKDCQRERGTSLTPSFIMRSAASSYRRPRVTHEVNRVGLNARSARITCGARSTTRSTPSDSRSHGSLYSRGSSTLRDSQSAM